MPDLYKELEIAEPNRQQADHSIMQHDPNPQWCCSYLQSVFKDGKQIEIGLWVQ